MHVLGVAGIDHEDGVSFDAVSVVPFVGVGHVVVGPACQRRLAPEQRPLDLIHREHGVLHITFQILLVVGVTVLLRHVAVKREDLPGRTRLDDIFVINRLHRCRQFPP